MLSAGSGGEVKSGGNEKSEMCSDSLKHSSAHRFARSWCCSSFCCLIHSNYSIAD